jgi:mRNA-degrading endonuclease RelE of RelBE toxin-antitoxin system
VTYNVFLEPEVHRSRTRLPDDFRQRLRRVIGAFANDPRPAQSVPLDVAGLELGPGVDVRRYRLDPWRLVYAVNDEEKWVWVLALRRRPPYDYVDLIDLLAALKDEPDQ